MGYRGVPLTELIFEDAKVPKTQLLGEEGTGMELAKETSLIYPNWCCCVGNWQCRRSIRKFHKLYNRRAPIWTDVV